MRLLHFLARCLERRRQWRQLLDLDDHLLSDIGVTRDDLFVVIPKPPKPVPARKPVMRPGIDWQRAAYLALYEEGEA